MVIESTGISEPLPVAATFDFRDEEGFSLGDVAKIDTMVTIVDAANLLKDYSSSDFLSDRGESLGEDDVRPLVQLLVEQIEFADVLILNKTDAVSEDQLVIVRKLLRALNADAKIIESSFSKVDLSDVMGTGGQEHRVSLNRICTYDHKRRKKQPFSIRLTNSHLILSLCERPT